MSQCVKTTITLIVPLVIFLGSYYLFPLIQVNTLIIPTMYTGLGFACIGGGMLLNSKAFRRIGLLMLGLVLFSPLLRLIASPHAGCSLAMTYCSEGANTLYCGQAPAIFSCSNTVANFSNFNRGFVSSLPWTAIAYGLSVFLIFGLGKKIKSIFATIEAFIVKHKKKFFISLLFICIIAGAIVLTKKFSKNHQHIEAQRLYQIGEFSLEKISLPENVSLLAHESGKSFEEVLEYYEVATEFSSRYTWQKYQYSEQEYVFYRNGQRALSIVPDLSMEHFESDTYRNGHQVISISPDLDIKNFEEARPNEMFHASNPYYPLYYTRSIYINDPVFKTPDNISVGTPFSSFLEKYPDSTIVFLQDNNRKNRQYSLWVNDQAHPFIYYLSEKDLVKRIPLKMFESTLDVSYFSPDALIDEIELKRTW